MVTTDEVKKLLDKKEEYNKKLGVAENKIAELEEEIKEQRAEIIETFGTDDVQELDEKAEELVAKLHKLNKEIQELS